MKGAHSYFWLYIAAAVIGWAVMLFALDRLRSRTKKRLVVITVFLCGLFYVLEFFLPGESALFFWDKHHQNPLHPYLDPIGKAMGVVGAFTLLLGVINLCNVHGSRVLRRRAGWHNSVAFFVAMVAMIFFGFFEHLGSHTAGYWKPFHTIYDALFNGAYFSLSSTMFSLLAFYIAAAAYRAFRVRSAEAVVMVIAAFLVMVGQVPIGMWLTHGLPTDGWISSFRAENIALWLVGVISMSGLRAIAFGIGVGGLAMSLRLWLNLEKGAFFEQEF